MLFCFKKKSAAESHRMLVTYGDNALSETTCRDWFRRFNADNFDLSDKKRENMQEGWRLSIAGSFGRGRYPIAKNACRAIGFLKQLFPCGYMPWERFKRSENGCRMNWTIDRWTDVKTCQILLARQKRKSFLHRIVTGDEKWIYFQNPKCKKSWVDPAQSSISFSRSNRFGWKMMLCVWWEMTGGRHLLRVVKTWWNC